MGESPFVPAEIYLLSFRMKLDVSQNDTEVVVSVQKLSERFFSLFSVRLFDCIRSIEPEVDKNPRNECIASVARDLRRRTNPS
mmetsp:Transcript_2344/g.4042  ORF Transcript_2344/g.4042 Transcript_2344/m.4042 type:complete len:83 (+) Transcript_2344:296-544(+)